MLTNFRVSVAYPSNRRDPENIIKTVSNSILFGNYSLTLERLNKDYASLRQQIDDEPQAVLDKLNKLKCEISLILNYFWM